MAGLYLGHRAPQAHPIARLQTRAVWQAADTLLEAFVFALIGLQLRAVTDAVDGRVMRLALIGVVLMVVAVVVRFAWVFPTTYLPRRLSPRVRDREPAPPWRYPAVISWAGMRGPVSLAAAAALPLTTESGGAPFPGRAEIVFLAFFFTVGTLLLQGATLPVVIRRLGVEGAEHYTDALAEAQAQTEATRAAAQRLDELDDGNPLHQPIITKLRVGLEMRTNAAWERLGGPSDTPTPSEAYRRIRREMLAAERAVFVRHRNERRIDDEVFRRIQHELDLEEVMLDRA
jgi:CPA1 family monovalent cation:H+ antiporter